MPPESDNPLSLPTRLATTCVVCLALDANVLLVYVVTILTRYVPDSTLDCYEEQGYLGHHVIGGMLILTAGVAVSGLIVHGQFAFAPKPNSAKLAKQISVFALALFVWTILDSITRMVMDAMIPAECEALRQESISFIAKASVMSGSDHDLIRFAEIFLWVSWSTSSFLASSFATTYRAQILQEPHHRAQQLPSQGIRPEVLGSVSGSVLGMPVVESCKDPDEEHLRTLPQDSPL